MTQNEYCPKCGAYIPKGESKCFACGFAGIVKQNDPYVDALNLRYLFGQGVHNAYITNITRYGIFAPGNPAKVTVTIIGTLNNDMEEQE
jgi:hypothetical protein